jgi:hypothetical protein
MKKPIDISKYAKIECIIHSFKSDSNGNPIALFVVNAYKMAVQTSPTSCLYDGSRRRQVSYAGTELAYAKDALQAANINYDNVSFSHCSGSRSQDCVVVCFHVVPESEIK